MILINSKRIRFNIAIQKLFSSMMLLLLVSNLLINSQAFAKKPPYTPDEKLDALISIVAMGGSSIIGTSIGGHAPAITATTFLMGITSWRGQVGPFRKAVEEYYNSGILTPYLQHMIIELQKKNPSLNDEDAIEQYEAFFKYFESLEQDLSSKADYVCQSVKRNQDGTFKYIVQLKLATDNGSFAEFANYSQRPAKTQKIPVSISTSSLNNKSYVIANGKDFSLSIQTTHIRLQATLSAPGVSEADAIMYCTHFDNLQP